MSQYPPQHQQQYPPQHQQQYPPQHQQQYPPQQQYPQTYYVPTYGSQNPQQNETKQSSGQIAGKVAVSALEAITAGAIAAAAYAPLFINKNNDKDE